MVDLLLAEERLRHGLFNSAAESLGVIPVSSVRDSWQLALTAETYERIGRTADAMAIVREVSRRESKGRALARACIVAGVVELESNNAISAVASHERALDLAEAGSHPFEAAWSHLRLLLARFESEAALDLDAAIADLRPTLERANDLGVSTAFHIFASEMYAKRGLLPEARRHLDHARDRLRRLDNPWLEGLYSIASFCQLYLDMDFLTAEQAAKQALRLSGVSGHVRGEFAAIIDLAHVWMCTGRLEDAARMLRRASNMCDLSPRCRDSVRDGLAQLELYRGNIPGGRTLVDQVLASDGPRHSYSRAWSALTRAEMLLREGLIAECQSQCEKTLASLPVPPDRGLVLRLRLVLAEALARSGSLAEAATVAALARRDALDSPVGLLAEINQRLARVLALGGLPLQAAAFEERAQRLQTSRREVSAPSAAVQPVDAPERHGITQDACARALDRTAAIFEQADRPDLAASEIGRLLDDLDCCRRWAVVQDTGGSHAVLDASEGLTDTDLRQLVDDSIGMTIDLGERGTHHITVVAEPEPTVGAIASLSAVMRLIHRSSFLFAPAVRAGLVPGTSVARESMSGVLRTAKLVAGTDVPVLLLGETGVGKEWLARRIHEWSSRQSRAFVGFNCVAVGREMLEAQLFGHRRGAFTGALDASPGVLRGSEGGTVLLDEIGEVATDIQVKLLRFLESGEVHAIGEPVPRRANVRVLAATNRTLDELASPTIMRRDLFYRISVVRIEIPPLRDRRDEIVPIALDALHRAARECRRSPLALSATCREALTSHDWPGNVRQLVNEMRRAAVLAGPREVVEPDDLSPEITSTPPVRKVKSSVQVAIDLDQTLDRAVGELERASIQRALALSHGRREQAATLLGLSRKGLYLKCQRLGVQLEPNPNPVPPRVSAPSESL
jgi:DNA-binding NtrC family response regulator/tetratricopeptide (TPR) repeat protein